METNVEKTFKFKIMQINLNLLKCIMSLGGRRIFNLNISNMKRTDDQTTNTSCQGPHFRQTADRTWEQWPAASLTLSSEYQHFNF